MSNLMHQASCCRPAQETFHVVSSEALLYGGVGGEGFLGKELLNAADGRQAYLIKVEPGAYAGSHSHDLWSTSS
ncbi:MAG: hypothetical protein KUL88_15525 [Rhizobium sp.]|nr:hypothetical protein [Rhizobium sp.]